MPENSKLSVSGATRGVEPAYRRPPEDVLREMADLLDSDSERFERLRHALSHDLRAPIRAIRSFAGLVDRRCAGTLDEKSRDFVRRIVAAGERAETLLDELLDELRQRCRSASPAAPDAPGAGPAEEQRRRAVMLLRRLAALGPAAAPAAPAADADGETAAPRRPEGGRR